MGSQANQLSQINTVNDLSLSDLIIIFTNANGDSRKSSINTLLNKFREEFTRPDYETTIYVPTTGFVQDVGQDGLNRWAIFRPTTSLATGEILLPSPSVASDGQEHIVTSTLQITSFTVDGNGASSVYGVPSSLAAEDDVKFRYNKQTTSWYRVG
jgi:hypothetical protein